MKKAIAKSLTLFHTKCFYKTSAATQHNFLLQNYLNHREAYCKTLLFQTIVLDVFFLSLLQHLHFLMRITLNHNFCNTNKNTENNDACVLGQTDVKKTVSTYSYIIQKKLQTTEHSLEKKCSRCKTNICKQTQNPNNYNILRSSSKSENC